MIKDEGERVPELDPLLYFLISTKTTAARIPAVFLCCMTKGMSSRNESRERDLQTNPGLEDRNSSRSAGHDILLNW